MSLKNTLAAAAVGLVGTTAIAQAQSIDLDSLLDGAGAKPITVKFSCGDEKKVNCAEIVPLIQSKLPSNVRLQPITGGGSVESAVKVCKAEADMAIGQADAFAIVNKTRCSGTFEQVSKPPYSYVGYLAVAANNPVSSLHDMTKTGNTVKIVAGGQTSGGNITAQALKLSDRRWDSAISIINESVDDGLQDLADGKVSAIYVMDAPKSPFIKQIESKVDAKGKSLFKLIEVNPYDAFLEAAAADGYKRYTSESITVPGFFYNGSLNTVGTPAQVIANSAWRQTPDGKKAYTAVRSAVEAANADILQATGTARGWMPTLQR